MTRGRVMGMAMELVWLSSCLSCRLWIYHNISIMPRLARTHLSMEVATVGASCSRCLVLALVTLVDVDWRLAVFVVDDKGSEGSETARKVLEGSSIEQKGSRRSDKGRLGRHRVVCSGSDCYDLLLPCCRRRKGAL